MRLDFNDDYKRVVAQLKVGEPVHLFRHYQQKTLCGVSKQDGLILTDEVEVDCAACKHVLHGLVDIHVERMLAGKKSIVRQPVTV